MKLIIFPLIVDAIRRLICNDTPPPAPPPAKPFPTEAEIDASLAVIAKAGGREKLDWRASIVDLLALLDLDNGLHSRGLLYAEMGASDDYKGTPAQNTWLIQQVRKRFASGQVG